MHFVFLSYGTRGDVQPQVALGTCLRERGHEVTICAPANLGRFVENAGLRYGRFPGDTQSILESDRGRRLLSSGNALAFFRETAEISSQVAPEAYQVALEAAATADYIVGGTFCEDLAVTLAEHYNVPACQIHSWPREPTRAFPDPLVTRANLPLGVLNKATYELTAWLGWAMVKKTLLPFRAQLGLPRQWRTVVGQSHNSGTPILQIWSPQVVPRPRELPAHVVTTGYIRLQSTVRSKLSGETPTAQLKDWLARGTPPVYLGLGSMPVVAPRTFIQMALEAAKALDVRLVVAAGWADFEYTGTDTEERAYFVRGVDHSWLFPQCVATVHHGGAGTTAASLEAGRPALVCSVFADQPFWGERLVRLGVGYHARFARLTRSEFIAGLQAVTSRDVQARAAEIGRRLREENGNVVATQALMDWAVAHSRQS